LVPAARHQIFQHVHPQPFINNDLVQISQDDVLVDHILNHEHNDNESDSEYLSDDERDDRRMMASFL